MLQSINALKPSDNIPESVQSYNTTITGYFQNKQITSEQFQKLIAAGNAKLQAPQPPPYILPRKDYMKYINPMPQLMTTPLGDTATNKRKYPHIDPVFQIMLATVNPDGYLGPKTQAALEVYKKSVGNPDMGNELAFEYLKKEPEYASKTPMEYDDNSNTYRTLKQKKRDNPQLIREFPED